MRGVGGALAAVAAFVATAGAAAVAPDDCAIAFEEVSTAWGLVFDHRHGGSGRRYMVEASTGGVVIVDVDDDGDDDVLFVDAGPLPGYAGPPPRSRLFRNDGGARFVDRTDRAAIEGPAYGTGGAAADVDGDRDVDLFLTGYRETRLLINRGDGSFEDGTAASGLVDDAWSTSAAFADLDRDGDLDLYLVRYVDYSVEAPVECFTRSGASAYCHPDRFEPVADRIFLNDGDGRFVEAPAAGAAADGKGLGVVIVDFDRDLWPDIYVANDTTPNHLLRNRGDGTFEDISLLSGTAFGDRLTAEAGMGVDAADVDLDGDLDLVVTNYALETNAVYLNQGGGIFAEGRHLTGIAEPSIPMLGFGVDFADFDQDGDDDLVIANGHVLDNIETERPGLKYRQPNQLLENRGGRFVDCPRAGLDVERVSRGLATGDLDGDGDLDLVVVNANERAEVYANRTPSPGAHLALALRGDGANSAAIGARLSLTAGGRTVVGEAVTATSFQSQNSLLRHFGVGEATVVEALEVRWPDGERVRWRALPVGARVVVAQSGTRPLRPGAEPPRGKLALHDGRTP